MAADLKKISYVYEHKNRSTSTIKNTNQLADSKISNICEQKDRSMSTMKNTSKLADSKESNVYEQKDRITATIKRSRFEKKDYSGDSSCLSPKRNKGRKRKMQTPLPPKRLSIYNNNSNNHNNRYNKKWKVSDDSDNDIEIIQPFKRRRT